MCNRLFVIFIFILLLSCSNSESSDGQMIVEEKTIKCAASITEKYFPELIGKKIGLIANHTSLIGKTHLLDTMISAGLNVKIVFAPEHGFRGDADAGEQITDSRDKKTNILIRSIYGKSKKPAQSDIKDLDVMVFDIQDVGVRFYTYISTLHYVMEACAEAGIPLIVLDRPNPNAKMIDGPVLDMEYSSFVGMHPVPVAYGMTIGEYAQMINGEAWLNNGISCDLKVIKCENYNHNMEYVLPVPPSPNLPNKRSIKLYPTLCFFEGTSLSVGRGTDMQFQVVGHPLLNGLSDFSFIPKPNYGAKYPKHDGEKCFGYDLRVSDKYFNEDINLLQVEFILKLYADFSDKEAFFIKPDFFDKLAGNSSFREMIITEADLKTIRQEWNDDLEAFKEIRKKYLLYK